MKNAGTKQLSIRELTVKSRKEKIKIEANSK